MYNTSFMSWFELVENMGVDIVVKSFTNNQTNK